ncbi:hypothetical protein STAS_13476 [Striga asiatica]|uniref:Uncharacterized protein n=1 Tax=Striga asiatica TaxID=4170 RepID=A0A5A7PWN9_STRAF|nr:hypothetical protein STAS_13476 [Striga asiatica]
MARLVRTALTITLNPGSVRTMSEALLAASVASATAIPMSAFFNAGASFTPSPVIPQMCFLSWSFFTISSSMGMEAIDSSLFWPRRADEGYMLVPIPSRRPVSIPIASWSPVIIFTLTPRSRALLMVSALSCLGGSKSGRRPTNSHGSPALSFVFSFTVCGGEK